MQLKSHSVCNIKFKIKIMYNKQYILMFINHLLKTLSHLISFPVLSQNLKPPHENFIPVTFSNRFFVPQEQTHSNNSI